MNVNNYQYIMILLLIHFQKLILSSGMTALWASFYCDVEKIQNDHNDVKFQKCYVIFEMYGCL